MNKVLLLILFVLIVPRYLFAVGDDSTYHRYTPFWTRFYFLGHRDKMKVIDTTLKNFSTVDPALRNPDERQLGNLGDPSFFLTPQVGGPSGLDVGMHAYDSYTFKADDAIFYQTQKPYTYLAYLLGSQAEQMFSGAHTQNVGSRYNFSVGFMRLGSSGTYMHERTDYLNINISQSFTSKNERYHADLLLFLNRDKIHLNGGEAVPMDSVYHSSKYITRDIVPVNLDTAMYKYNEQHVTLQHSYGWGNYYQHKVNDTTSKKRFCAAYLVEHRLDFCNVRHIFSDDSIDEAYFPKPLKNNLVTADTIQYHEFANELDLRIPDEKFRNDSITQYHQVTGAVFIKQSLYTFQHGGYSTVENGIIGLNLMDGLEKFNFANKGVLGELYSHTYWHLYSDYSLLGYNKGDYSTNANVLLHFSGMSLGISGLTRRHMPSLMEQSYSGNFYEWNNSFKAQTDNQYGVVIGLLGNLLKFSYFHTAFTNPVYYGYGVTPVQLAGSASSDVMMVQLNLQLHSFHLDNRFVWQKFNNDIFHYPSYYSNHSLYFGGNIFKKALQIQMGLEANYNVAYYSSAFDPSTSQFYLQNTVKTGDYLWMNAFASMKIRTVRVVLRADNILQGLFADNTEMAPGYIAADHSIKVYIYWMFWN